MISTKALFAVAAFTLAGALPITALQAADPIKITVQEQSNLKGVLTQLVGKRVQLTLSGGGELGGVIASVGDGVVLVTEVTGKEFYDAAVNLELVAAVTVRAR